MEISGFLRILPHAPSKVRATVLAVREQLPDADFVACLELQTFSSLNKDFINEYKHTLELPDYACVYFNEHILAMKRLSNLSKDDVLSAFDGLDLEVFVNSQEMINWLKSVKKQN